MTGPQPFFENINFFYPSVIPNFDLRVISVYSVLFLMLNSDNFYIHNPRYNCIYTSIILQSRFSAPLNFVIFSSFQMQLQLQANRIKVAVLKHFPHHHHSLHIELSFDEMLR